MKDRSRSLSLLLALLVLLPRCRRPRRTGPGEPRRRRVTDQDGKPIEGATVKIRLPDVRRRASNGRPIPRAMVVPGLRGGDGRSPSRRPGFMTGETLYSISEVVRGAPSTTR